MKSSHKKTNETKKSVKKDDTDGRTGFQITCPRLLSIFPNVVQFLPGSDASPSPVAAVEPPLAGGISLDPALTCSSPQLRRGDKSRKNMLKM